MIASRRHTIILLSILAALAVIGYLSNARGTAAQPNRLALYVSVAIGQLFLVRYVLAGLRVRVRELIGRPHWIDPLVAAAIWLAVRGFAMLTPHSGERTNNLLPRTRVELAVWIALAIVAGIAEELVFRGYLQRQIGVLAQAVVFGLAHGYQGFGAVARITVIGLIFGIGARYRKGLIGNMLGHAAIDISAAL